MAATRIFAKKLRIKLYESTVCGFKEAYKLSEILKDWGKKILSINELHPKKKGRLLLLGKNLDKALQEYILNLESMATLYWVGCYCC